MTSKLLALTLMLAAGGAAQADPRIATRFYHPSAIVTVHGRAGIESTIAFAPDERIENIAVGNSAAWQVTPNKRANRLFVKPAHARARTNMTVITDQRTYLFDLESSAVAPVYMLSFTYPDPPKPVVETAAATVPEAAVTVAEAAPPPPPSPTDLHFDWRAKGDKALLPARSFDDGRSTFLQWPKDAALPAILVREENGLEGPVNFIARDGYIVVEGVPAELILRTGKQTATLTPGPRPESHVIAPPDAIAQTASARP